MSRGISGGKQTKFADAGNGGQFCLFSQNDELRWLPRVFTDNPSYQSELL